MSRVADIARRWIGTPYVHQASVQGGGTDCLGLIRGVWRELYDHEPEAVPEYSRDWSEPQGDEVLTAAADRHFIRVLRGRDVRSGEMLLFRMRDGSVAKHLGVVGIGGNSPTFIHAYSGHGVVESHLSAAWQRRISARFDFPTAPIKET